MAASMINTAEWREVVKRTLKSEMQAHGLRYADLSRKLEERFGTIQTDANLRQKIGKGTLGAQLFLQLLLVIGVDQLNMHRIETMYDHVRRT